MDQFYVHFNGAAVFVKEASFLQAQKEDSPDWDTSAWAGPISADGVNHARVIGQQMVDRGELTPKGRR